MANTLIIDSTNPDFEGTWCREYVEEDVTDLKQFSNYDSNTWIEWILDHVFSDSKIPDAIYDVVAHYDDVTMLKANIDGYIVTFKKLS